MTNVKLSLIIAGAVIVFLVGFKLFLNSWEKSIRTSERETIATALEKEAAEKGLKVTKDVTERKAIIEKATPDQLVEYFRSGKLQPKGDNKDRPATRAN
jgi:hypothetical protein